MYICTYGNVVVLVFDGAKLEEPRQIVGDSADDWEYDESTLEVGLLERVRDREEALDRHRQGHQDGSDAANVSEAVP